MLAFYVIGERHDNKEDIEYKKRVEQAAKDKKLIYIQEGQIFGPFDEEEKVYSFHPNILGIEDLYIFMLTNLCLVRLFTS